jgi:hypothetical protein
MSVRYTLNGASWQGGGMLASVAGPATAALSWTRGQHDNGDGWRWSWTATVDDLGTTFGLQLVLACLVLVAALALAVAVRGRPAWRGLNPPSAVLAAGALAVIAACTLTPRDGPSSRTGQVQLVPFHTVREYWLLHSPSEVIVYIGGNVVLFVPLGFFAYLALRHSFGRCVALCAGVSGTIELLQLAMASRSTDIDDFLTNTLGGFLGVLAGWAAVRLAQVVRERRFVQAPQT